ncbi:MAG: hypothetical protein IJY39_04330 [Clostridia bacterium]|nr:hypothetical protein [Clostridia bacterium]
MLKKILIALLCACTLTTAMVSCDHSKNNENNDAGSNEQSTENTEKNEITAEEALEIAKEYWKDHDVEKNGYLIAEAVNKNAPDTVYVFVMKHLVVIGDSSHYSTIDEVWVDKSTGEAMPPYDAKP